jgi:hypothetical protein
MSWFNIRGRIGRLGLGGWFAAALAAILLTAIPGAALAQTGFLTDPNATNFLTMTELSSNELRVSFSLLGYTFNGDIAADAPNSAQYEVGPHFGNDVNSTAPDNTADFANIFWLQPGGDPANPLFTGYRIATCSCNDTGATITIKSDLTLANLDNLDDSNPWRDANCGNHEVGFTTCPLLANGGSFADPIRWEDVNAQQHVANPMTVTFTDDREGTGVPEPASWTLMLLGFGGLGAMLRARRALVPRPV